MKTEEKIINRFTYLTQKGDEVLKTRYALKSPLASDRVKADISTEWGTSVSAYYQ